jgi:mRNA interferase RelE/StbE
MAYNVELSEPTNRELGKLDAQQAKRILRFLHERVAKLDDPRSIGARSKPHLGRREISRSWWHLRPAR